MRRQSIVACACLAAGLTGSVLAAEPPSGFELEKREIADSAAERNMVNGRIREMMTRGMNERQQVGDLPGGQEALTALYKLQSAHKKRESELLQPVEVLEQEYADLLKKKLQSDVTFQVRKEAVASAEEELKDSNEVSELLEKHRNRVAGSGNTDVFSRDEVLAAVSESDDAPMLRKALQSNHAARQEIWRLRGEAGKRQREIEQTDPELLEIKRQEASLLRELKADVLAHDEQLQRLADKIAMAKREVEKLKVDASQEQAGDNN